ncbi:MAG: hypothetical protein ABI370_06740 [Gammaproteobacteria bacterium]
MTFRALLSPEARKLSMTASITIKDDTLTVYNRISRIPTEEYKTPEGKALHNKKGTLHKLSRDL